MKHIFLTTPEIRSRYIKLALLLDLKQAIAQLELISQAPTQNLDAFSRDSSGDIGGNKPSGGIDRRGDREPDYKLKSADHFRRRVQKARSILGLEEILTDIWATLRAWKCPDPPLGIEPERNTLAWKRMIANSSLSAERLAHKHEIGVRTVYRYRSLYRADA